MKSISLWIYLLIIPSWLAAQDHLLISEVAMQPTDGEFIEVLNPTNAPIALDEYYLADYNTYYEMVNAQYTSVSSDFIVQFPAGTVIPANSVLVIALNGSAMEGVADFEIKGTSAQVPDMTPLFVGASAGLTNTGEMVVLFRWDNLSDLIQDVDYLAWGSQSDRFADKTGISIDGPDGDTNASTYLNDTPVGAQLSVIAQHQVGESYQRLSSTENGETQNGGNGLTGHDETSEDMATSFVIGSANPGGEVGAPLIENVVQFPVEPTEADTVLISADVTDDGTITAVRLLFSLDGGAQDSLDMALSTGNTYQGALLPQPAGTLVEYAIKAVDNDSRVSQTANFSYTVLVSAPVISNIVQTPSFPAPGEDVTITADVSDNGSLSSVDLFYALDSGAFTATGMTNTAGNTYQGQIPGQTDGTAVAYFIRAEDNDGNTTLSDTLSYTVTQPGQGHLLISEIVVAPSEGEFVEIYNPTSAPIDLSNYYLTDATFATGNQYYYNIVLGDNTAGGGGFSDFHARFPAGAVIAPGEFQSIAMNGTQFTSTYNQSPTYELFDTDAAIPDMLEAFSGSINNQGGFTDNGEMVVIYTWDGQSDLVQDVDYAVWGDKVEAVDKTGVSIDGPDPDNTPSSYQNDTAIINQISLSDPDTPPHQNGESLQRITFEETGETPSGGNGLTGHDETSEDLLSSFAVKTPTPNAAPPAPGTPEIVDVTRDPNFPTSSDDVTVTAQITDDGTVTAQLFVSIDGAPFDSSLMNFVGNDFYEAVIDSQQEGVQVRYFVKATDNDGLSANSTIFSYQVISSSAGGAHLLISEIAVSPTEGEFIEIYNPTGQTIDLSDYYLTDATFSGGEFYYNIVTGQNAGGGGFGDFHVRFPDGASIAPGAVQTIAINGSNFEATYGISATYEVVSASGNAANMREALSGSVDPQSGLTNSGEVVILYHWDGQSDLVEDVDYVVWGDKAEAVDKTGLSIDGPDPDNTPSTYLPDIAIDAQISLSEAEPHNPGESVQRLLLSEESEIQAGGNGITGHNEMSEDLFSSFVVSAPTPNQVPVPGAPVVDSVAVSPESPGDQDPVLVTAHAVDADGQVTSVSLTYIVNNNVPQQLSMAPIGGDFYQATIPPQANASVVQYFAEATDNDGKTGRSATDFYVVGTVNGVIPIAAIQDNFPVFDGQVVTIEGVVTLGSGITTLTSTSAYIQDESGKGINVFTFDDPTPNDGLQRFNRVRVTGEITEFSGVTEITNYTLELLSEGNPLPDPLFVSSIIANDLTYEGTYMKVLGEVTDITPNLGGGTNITLTDDFGDILIRVWDSAELDISFLQVGDSASVQGVMGIFSNAAQIVPGYQDEINVPGETARADGSGLVSAEQDAVAAGDTLDSFTISIIGELDEPLTAIRLDVPKLWRWSGELANLSLTGALSQATAQVVVDAIDSVQQILILGASVMQGDTARITLQNIVTPSEPLNSVFWVRTAGEGGRLKFVFNSPVVNVGGGTRFLIYDVQTNSAAFSGTVTLQGVTTIGVGLLRETVSSGDSVTSVYIQDESGRGVNLFAFGVDREFLRGNRVQVQGTVVEFNGVTEVEYTSVQLLEENVPLPNPIKLTNSEANSSRWDGTLIYTEGVILERFTAGGGTSLEIGDGKGTTSVRIWDTANLDLTGFNENVRILVEGVSGLFISRGDTIFQLLPTYQDQIQVDPNYAPSLENVSLRVEPHPFVPDRGETIEIRYNAGVVKNQVAIRIFDLGGRLITTLLDEEATLVENTFTWNGRDRLNEMVPLGTYLCHMEVIEPLTGKKKTRVAPIVVGTILSR